jgi:hypothetical protein
MQGLARVPSEHDSQSGPDHPGKHSHVPALEHALVFEHVVASQYVSQSCHKIDIPCQV